MIDLSDSNISGKKDTWKNGLSLYFPRRLYYSKSEGRLISPFSWRRRERKGARGYQKGLSRSTFSQLTLTNRIGGLLSPLVTSGRILNYPCVRSIDNEHVEVFDPGYVTVHTHASSYFLPYGMHLYSRMRYNHPRRHCNIVLTANRRVVRSITRRDFLVDR